ncbi:MAG: type III-B CRISPR module-associated protein Cmr5 [Victivallales bacterium]
MSKIQNLDQKRAFNAITAQGKWEGVNDGEVVKKIPALIRENGLLGAAAFALEKKGGHEDVFNAIIRHLADPDIHKIEKAIPLQAFILKTAEMDSSGLRAITSESMAFLNYLRRFAKKNSGGE